jgi:preprotein translocase subunit SecG
MANAIFNVLIVVHLLITIALIVVILIQRSEGGGLGIGGGGGTMGGFMTARGTANLLTRTTAILAGAFMLLSLVLALTVGRPAPSRDLVDPLAPQAPAGAPTQPLAPSTPAPPIAQ